MKVTNKMSRLIRRHDLILSFIGSGHDATMERNPQPDGTRGRWDAKTTSAAETRNPYPVTRNPHPDEPSTKHPSCKLRGAERCQLFLELIICTVLAKANFNFFNAVRSATLTGFGRDGRC